MTARILIFSGSSREASYNTQLARAASDAVQKAGGIPTLIGLDDFDMPIYNQDLEAAKGLPEGVIAFRQVLADHQGLLIASPEYNGNMTPLLLNALDWASRKGPEEPPLPVYRDKVAALLAASPGGLGGLRGLSHLRDLLNKLGVLVLPEQLAVGSAFKAFTETGSLSDEAQQARLEKIAGGLVSTIDRLYG